MRTTVFSLPFPLILQITFCVGFKESQSIIRMHCLKTYRLGGVNRAVCSENWNH